MDTAREILPLLDVLGIGEAQAIADLEAAVVPQGKLGVIVGQQRNCFAYRTPGQARKIA